MVSARRSSGAEPGAVRAGAEASDLCGAGEAAVVHGVPSADLPDLAEAVEPLRQ